MDWQGKPGLGGGDYGTRGQQLAIGGGSLLALYALSKLMQRKSKEERERERWERLPKMAAADPDKFMADYPVLSGVMVKCSRAKYNDSTTQLMLLEAANRSETVRGELLGALEKAAETEKQAINPVATQLMLGQAALTGPPKTPAKMVQPASGAPPGASSPKPAPLPIPGQPRQVGPTQLDLDAAKPQWPLGIQRREYQPPQLPQGSVVDPAYWKRTPFLGSMLGQAAEGAKQFGLDTHRQMWEADPTQWQPAVPVEQMTGYQQAAYKEFQEKLLKWQELQKQREAANALNRELGYFNAPMPGGYGWLDYHRSTGGDPRYSGRQLTRDDAFAKAPFQFRDGLPKAIDILQGKVPELQSHVIQRDEAGNPIALARQDWSNVRGPDDQPALIPDEKATEAYREWAQKYNDWLRNRSAWEKYYGRSDDAGREYWDRLRTFERYGYGHHEDQMHEAAKGMGAYIDKKYGGRPQFYRNQTRVRGKVPKYTPQWSDLYPGGSTPEMVDHALDPKRWGEFVEVVDQATGEKIKTSPVAALMHQDYEFADWFRNQQKQNSSLFENNDPKTLVTRHKWIQDRLNDYWGPRKALFEHAKRSYGYAPDTERFGGDLGPSEHSHPFAPGLQAYSHLVGTGADRIFDPETAARFRHSGVISQHTRNPYERLRMIGGQRRMDRERAHRESTRVIDPVGFVTGMGGYRPIQESATHWLLHATPQHMDPKAMTAHYKSLGLSDAEAAQKAQQDAFNMKLETQKEQILNRQAAQAKRMEAVRLFDRSALDAKAAKLYESGQFDGSDNTALYMEAARQLAEEQGGMTQKRFQALMKEGNRLENLPLVRRNYGENYFKNMGIALTQRQGGDETGLQGLWKNLPFGDVGRGALSTTAAIPRSAIGLGAMQLDALGINPGGMKGGKPGDSLKDVAAAPDAFWNAITGNKLTDETGELGFNPFGTTGNTRGLKLHERPSYWEQWEIGGNQMVNAAKNPELAKQQMTHEMNDYTLMQDVPKVRQLQTQVQQLQSQLQKELMASGWDPSASPELPPQIANSDTYKQLEQLGGQLDTALARYGPQGVDHFDPSALSGRSYDPAAQQRVAYLAHLEKQKRMGAWDEMAKHVKTVEEGGAGTRGWMRMLGSARANTPATLEALATAGSYQGPGKGLATTLAKFQAAEPLFEGIRWGADETGLQDAVFSPLANSLRERTSWNPDANPWLRMAGNYGGNLIEDPSTLFLATSGAGLSRLGQRAGTKGLMGPALSRMGTGAKGLAAWQAFHPLSIGQQSMDPLGLSNPEHGQTAKQQLAGAMQKPIADPFGFRSNLAGAVGVDAPKVEQPELLKPLTIEPPAGQNPNIPGGGQDVSRLASRTAAPLQPQEAVKGLDPAKTADPQVQQQVANTANVVKQQYEQEKKDFPAAVQEFTSGQPGPHSQRVAQRLAKETGAKGQDLAAMYGQLDPGSKTLLWLGLGVGAVGMLNALTADEEDSTTMDWLTAVLGLGTAAGIGASAGMFGQGPQDAMRGLGGVFASATGGGAEQLSDKALDPNRPQQMTVDPKNPAFKNFQQLAADGITADEGQQLMSDPQLRKVVFGLPVARQYQHMRSFLGNSPMGKQIMEADFNPNRPGLALGVIRGRVRDAFPQLSNQEVNRVADLAIAYKRRGGK